MKEINYLLRDVNLLKLIKYCSKCYSVFCNLTNGTGEDYEEEDGYTQKIYTTKSFLIIVAEKYIKSFNSRRFVSDIAEYEVSILKDVLECDASKIIRQILSDTTEVFAELDKIGGCNEYEKYHWVRNKDAENEILSIIRYFSENSGLLHSKVEPEELIPDMIEKAEKLHDQYFEGIWYDDWEVGEFVIRLSLKDPNFWGWLFDNPALNGKKLWQLSRTQQEAVLNLLSLYD